jgi:hypothetical protein
MAVTKIKQLDSVEILPDDRFRVVISTYFKDSLDGSESASREPQYIVLDPSQPAHQPLINAARSTWATAKTTFGVDR